MAPARAGEGVLAEAGGPLSSTTAQPPNVSMLAVICMVVRAYAEILEINVAAGAGAPAGGEHVIGHMRFGHECGCALRA